MAKVVQTSSSRKAATAPPATPRGWRRHSKTLITATFFATILGAAALLYQQLPDLTQRPEYQFRMSETRTTAPSAWVPRTILTEVLTAAELPETVSLLDPDLCRKVALGWKQHPWVQAVKSVRITSEPALCVDLIYREPAAFIEVPKGVYPVSADGVLLPPADFSMSDTSRLPHVRNIRSLPHGGVGAAWGDPVVLAAVRLAAVLAPQQNLETYWKPFKLAAIVAPAVSESADKADSPIFELETVGGNRIVWGKAPGADTLEPTPQVKLARLQEYQSRFGSLDGINGLHRIDIRLFDGISLQPLEERLYR